MQHELVAGARVCVIRGFYKDCFGLVLGIDGEDAIVKLHHESIHGPLLVYIEREACLLVKHT